MTLSSSLETFSAAFSIRNPCDSSFLFIAKFFLDIIQNFCPRITRMNANKTFLSCIRGDSRYLRANLSLTAVSACDDRPKYYMQQAETRSHHQIAVIRG